MANSLSYDRMRIAFMEAVKTSMKRSNVDAIQTLFDSFPEPESDRRNALDQAFRDLVLQLLSSGRECTAESVWESMVARCVDACRRQLATPTVPVVVLSDVFDCLTLDRCERLFTYVETNVAIWKEELFFNACKNNLLRMCNDLLRRLSRSQNTVFCGRILLFLAKFFPFSERSGLNIVSEFNIENVTEYSGDDSMDITETEEIKNETLDESTVDKIKIDYNLYSKFWSLQNFFRNPLLVYSKVQWKTFVSHTDNVLSAFKSFKLEGVQNKKSMPAEEMVKKSAGNEHYFAKFLTNQKLLELQLCDVNFRRYVLVQFLILFQYLNATVKFKSETQELKGAEAEWVEQTTESVYSLLRETPPDGAAFAQTVQHVLKREEFWNNWKNEGCPELRKPLATEDQSDEEKQRAMSSVRPQKRPRKRLGQMIKEGQAHKKFIMGNSELTRLWNFMPDNLEACRAPERNFLMSLDEYFKEAIEQLDPAAMVEDQYKVVNDGNFGWRALRLLVLQSSHFFTHSNNPINKLPEYLETMIKKIAKERPIILPSGEVKQELLSGDVSSITEANNGNLLDNEPDADEDDELLKSTDEKRSDEQEMGNSEDGPETPETTQKPLGISAAILDIVAKSISPQWKDLAGKMDFKDTAVDSINKEITPKLVQGLWSDEQSHANLALNGNSMVQYVEESKSTDVARARYVLQLWTEEDVDPTPPRLAKLLREAGFAQEADQVLLLS